MYTGLHDQRNRLGWPAPMYAEPLTGNEREKTGRPQSIRARGDKSVDDVS